MDIEICISKALLVYLSLSVYIYIYMYIYIYIYLDTCCIYVYTETMCLSIYMSCRYIPGPPGLCPSWCPLEH